MKEANRCETDVKNTNQLKIGPELEMNDTEMDTKPSCPLYNLYPMNIKVDVNDPDPPFFPLTSVVKSELHTNQFDIPYFDHSSIIQQNLKTESEDEEGNCEDPLSVADSVPFGETPETSFQVLGQHPSVKKQTGEESNCRFCKRRYSGEGECGREKTCEKCLMAASIPNKHETGRTGDKKRPYECETCGKGFATHTGAKPFECETCRKCFAFAESSYFPIHVITHKEFKCEIYGKCFPYSYILTRHKKSHSGEKPFACETCGRRFTQNSDLTTQKTFHPGEQPSECEICGKSFGRKKDLIDHMILHV